MKDQMGKLQLAVWQADGGRSLVVLLILMATLQSLLVRRFLANKLKSPSNNGVSLHCNIEFPICLKKEIKGGAQFEIFLWRHR